MILKLKLLRVIYKVSPPQTASRHFFRQELMSCQDFLEVCLYAKTLPEQLHKQPNYKEKLIILLYERRSAVSQQLTAD